AMIQRTINRAVDSHSRASNSRNEALEAIVNFARSALVPETSISVSDLRNLKDDDIKKTLYNRAMKVYNAQISKLSTPDAILEFQKVHILMVVDNKWTEHIDALD
ncbi:preprotein translocase subunit SecA, partial [Streptococcus suis]